MFDTARDSEAGRLWSRRICLIAIFLTAFGFRTCVVLRAPTTPVADAALYHRLATGLAQGRGYVNTEGQKTAWAPPAYPAFLSIIYRVAGPNVTFATIVQAVLGALAVLALVMFAGLVIGWREGIIAGFIAAVYPGLVWLPRLLLSENLSLLLLLLTLCAVALYLRTNHIWWMAMFGLLSGMNTLVRGGNLFVFFLLAAGILITAFRQRSPDSRPRRVAPLLIAGSTFCLVLAPWSIRNYHTFGRFVPIATQEGLTLYASYWPPVKNGRLIWGTLPGPEDPTVAAAANLGDEASASKYFRSVTLQRLRAQPGYFFRVIPSKMISLLVPLDWEILPHAAGSSRSLNVGYLLILLPSVFGFLLLLRKPQPNRWLLWMVPITVLIQTIFFYGSPRFRLPAEPIAILLAAVSLSHFVRSRTGFLKTRPPLLG